jgi:hypothetical protein
MFSIVKAYSFIMTSKPVITFTVLKDSTIPEVNFKVSVCEVLTISDLLISFSVVFFSTQEKLELIK